LLVSTPSKISQPIVRVSTFTPSPGKSPVQKKSTKSLDFGLSIPSTSKPKSKKSLTTVLEAVSEGTEPEYFEHYCQFCLKKGGKNVLWIQCNGGVLEMASS
jgi:hypothetical protein